MDFLKSSMGGQSNHPETENPQIHNAQAIEEPASPTSDVRQSSDDPFASQREQGVKWDMFAEKPEGSSSEIPLSQRERRMSKEWDASKVPPSRFQKREGSIHATPASRDGHIDRNKLKVFADKYLNKDNKPRRKSST